MRRLLNKPLKAFAGLATIILICSIPVYFFLIESIWIDELDDHNQGIKDQIHKGFSGLNANELNVSLSLWNRVHPESRISPAAKPSNDSIYTIEREVLDGKELEMERFRGLVSNISLNDGVYRVRIETNVEEVNETVLAISTITGCFIVLILVGFMILNRRIAKNIWSPFTDTLKKLKRFDLNNSSDIQFTETNIIEFSELNQTLEKLIKNNIQVYRQQKEFTQNASHELQTPLALLKSKLDLLIQDSKLTEEHRGIIDSLNHSISRITRINKNLLLLARIENRDYESSNINVNSLVGAVAAIFKEYSEPETRVIAVNSIDTFNVVANEGLVEVLVSNLVSNAMRHGTTSTPITLTISNKRLTVTNSGKTELDPDSLFKRFISANSQTQGTGLGLAIVKEICEKYCWKISYGFSNNQHVFTVAF